MYAEEEGEGRFVCVWGGEGAHRQQQNLAFPFAGQNGGDSDRYLPAVLYGCIPVFTSEGGELWLRGWISCLLVTLV